MMTNRKSPGEYYRSREWRGLRLATFRRDKFKCLCCGNRFAASGLNAHHLIPRDEGGADDIANLVTLCPPCHDFVEINNLRSKADIIGAHSKPETPQSAEMPHRVVVKRTAKLKRPRWSIYPWERYSQIDPTPEPVRPTIDENLGAFDAADLSKMWKRIRDWKSRHRND